MYSKIQSTGIYWLFTGFWRRNGGQSAAVVCTMPTSLDFVIKSGEGWTSSFSRFGQGDLSEKWQAESWMMRMLYGLRKKKKKNKDPPKRTTTIIKEEKQYKIQHWKQEGNCTIWKSDSLIFCLQKGNWSPERQTDLPMVTQLGSNLAGNRLNLLTSNSTPCWVGLNLIFLVSKKGYYKNEKCDTKY